ncbi:Hypothetical_protein [Hexamita inflata]|uniref:Hypothetical_protein n=1 Tax=Hexamita inflata TaxID=28002 RepID=A0AA86UXW6_9EUKA|nr:Hypothetical protein HINF_LOCUS56627 [Hexamita inflata]
MNKIRQLTQNRKPSQSQRKPRRKSSKLNIRNSLSKKRAKEDIKATKPQEIANPSPAIYPEIRNLQEQINQNGTQVPNQVNEPMHQRLQTEGNNEHKEIEKRESVSQKQVSESAETGPLRAHVLLSKVSQFVCAVSRK